MSDNLTGTPEDKLKRSPLTWQSAPTRTHASNNFDLLRLIAATAVLFSHAFPLTQGSNANEPMMRLSGGQSTLGYLAVCIFFVMSGYLITASFLSSRSLASYSTKRLLRIYPALIVMTLFTVLVLGPSVTALSLDSYLKDGRAYAYLLNMAAILPAPVGLPGVFAGNHFANAVNGSLWTLKFEIFCYVAVGILGVAFFLRTWIVAILWVGSFVIALVLNTQFPSPEGIWFYLSHFTAFFQFFGAGMLYSLLRERIPLDNRYLVASLTACVAGLLTNYFLEIFAIFGSYAILRLALARPVAVSHLIAKRGDVSYGIYIYAFPVQQAVAHFLPGLLWYENAAVAFPVVLALSFLSWTLIERPALTLKSLV